MLTQEQLNELSVPTYNRPLDQSGVDVRVQGLVDNIGFNLYKCRILDIGSLDGLHACQLAKFGAFVTCSDIRPVNLMKSLYRALFLGVNNMTYRLLDMETMHHEIKKDEYNIIFHSGSFYHLHNPIKHLFDIKDLAEYILLETHIANPDKFIVGTMDYLGETYNGTYYPEGGFSDTQAAKDTRPSFWLTNESLEKLFKNCNLKIVSVVYKDLVNPHGLRNCWLLKRG